jgi:TP901 family phage tail tape measure protein
MSIIEHRDIIGPDGSIKELIADIEKLKILIDSLSKGFLKDVVNPNDEKAVKQKIADAKTILDLEEKRIALSKSVTAQMGEEKKLEKQINNERKKGLEAERAKNAKGEFKEYIKGLTAQNTEVKKLSDRYKGLEAASNDAAKSLKKLRDAQFNGGFKEYIKSLTTVSEKSKKLSAYYRELEAASNGVTKSLQRQREVQSKGQFQEYIKSLTAVSDQSKKLSAYYKELEIASKRNAQQTLGIAGTYKRVSDRLNFLRKAYKDAALAEGDFTKRQGILKKEIDRLDASLKKVDASVGQFQRNVGNYPKSLNAARGAFLNLASAAGVTFGAFGAYRVIEDGVAVLRKFETQLVAVGKTTNIQGPELELLGKAFRDLATGDLKGVKIDDLLELAETAGQLGIQGSANILKFTETLARLEKSTDVVGQEGALSIARILNVTNEAPDTVDRFGSAIVALGNNFAATESEIIDNTTEIARGIAVYGASAQQAAALGTVTRSLGVQSEVAGSAIQRTFAEIENALEGGGKQLEALEEITGRTAEQLRKDFAEDAVGVFELFIKGVNRTKEETGTMSKALRDLNVDTIRYDKVLKPLAGRYDELSRALRLSESAYQQNIALTIESERALDTLDSEIIGLRSSWQEYVLSTDKASGASSKLRDVVAFLSDNLKAIVDTVAVLLISWGAYKLLMGGVAAVTYLNTKAQAAWTNGIRATIFQARILQGVLATFGWGALALAIGYIVTNLDSISASMRGTTKEAELLREEINKVADQKKELLSKLLTLNTASDEYAKTLANINAQFPDLIDQTKLQANAQDELTAALKRTNEEKLRDIATSDSESKLNKNAQRQSEILSQIETVLATRRAELIELGISPSDVENISSVANRDNLIAKFGESYNRQLIGKGAGPLIGLVSEATVDERKQAEVILSEIGELASEYRKISKENSDLQAEKQKIANSFNGPEELDKFDVLKNGFAVTDPNSPGQRVKTFKPVPVLTKQQSDELEEEAKKEADKLKRLRDQAEARAKSARESLRRLQVEEQQNIIKKNQAILDNSDLERAVRGDAAIKISEAENRIAQIGNQSTLDDKELTTKEKFLIEKNYLSELEFLEADHLERIAELDKEAADKRNEYLKYLNQEYQAELDNQLEELDRSIKGQEDVLKKATGKKKREAANELLELYKKKADLEILLAETQARFDDIGASDEDKAITKIELTGEASKIRADLEEAKRAIEAAFDTDPLEKFRRVAEGVFDRLLDRAVALQQRQLELSQQKLADAKTAISVQEQRAAQGQKNTLAFEKKRLAEREKIYQDHQKKLERIEKARAFFSLLSSNANNKDATKGDALAKTILEFSLAEAFVAGFKDGGYTGGGNVTDVAGPVHKREFVIDAPTVERLGLRGASMSDFNRRFIPDNSGGVVDMNHFNKERGRLVKDVPVLNDVGIRKDLQKLIGIMESKEQTEWKFDEFANGILRATETKKRNGKTVVNKYSLRP